ncbi:MAG: hypothetical protein R3A10_20385 [Caldilineaceae bacterium]
MLHSRRVRWRTAFSYAIVIITVMAVMTVAILRFFNQRMLATATTRAPGPGDGHGDHARTRRRLG